MIKISIKNFYFPKVFIDNLQINSIINLQSIQLFIFSFLYQLYISIFLLALRSFFQKYYQKLSLILPNLLIDILYAIYKIYLANQ